MAKSPRAKKASQKSKPVSKAIPKPVQKPIQPSLPGMPQPEPRGTTRVFSMQLLVGDKFSDESGDWEVVARPYAIAGGKSTHVRVQRLDKPSVTETRSWSSYEKVAVIRRTTSNEGKR
jgi:hypothetical protein